MLVARLSRTRWTLLLWLLVAAGTWTVTEEAEVQNSTSGDTEENEHEEENEPVHAVLLPWFTQAVGLVAYFLLSRYVHGIPYTCVLFILGTFMGSGALRTDFQDSLTESINTWSLINGEVLLNVFLPGLLFKDAIEINFHLFQASLPQLLLLAFPMVLAGTVLTALVAYYIFPYDWDWFLCMTFGSILAATDPVAVSALLNEVGAPPRLKMHIAGESLLNDGSAVVFFTVFSEIFLSQLDIGLGADHDWLEGLLIFLRMSLGGCAVGIAFAVALIGILHYLDRRYEHEDTVLQVAATVTVAYLSFFTSEITCKMSGVIAVVICGVVTKAFGGTLISDWKVMNSFWDLLEHLLNTLLFALAGIQFGSVIAEEDEERWTGTDWGYLIVLYLLVNIIRFGLIFGFFPIISRIGIKSNWKEALFSSWAGLRGAVGIALALGLDAEVHEATDNTEIRFLTSRAFGMVGGVAFLTLVFNGTLSGPLLKYLELAETTESRKAILKSVEKGIRKKLLDDFIFLMTDPRFFHIEFHVVQDHIPRMKDLSAHDLDEAVTSNMESVSAARYRPPSLDRVFPYIDSCEFLRQKLEKAKRQMFMQSTLSNVEHAIHNDDVEIPEVPPGILKDMRLLFVELLRGAYSAQIRDGELDPREYDGFLAYSLLQSIEFAHDMVMANKPVEDWQLSRVVSTDYLDKTRDGFVKLYGMLMNLSKVSDHYSVADTVAARDSGQLRLVILRAFSFVDAHKEAQSRLRDEFEKTDGDMHNAFLTVMRESQRQVKLAEESINSKTKKELRRVISHYMCTTLLNKTARYISVLNNTGVLLPREARELLEEIDESLVEVRLCAMDVHPGEIEVIEDIEILGDNPAASLRRRVRKKQTSIM